MTTLRPGRRSAFADRLLEFPDFVFSDGREFARRGAWHGFFSRRLGGAGFDRSTNWSAGSIVVVQRSRKTFFASRFFSTTLTGDAGAGKRKDS